MFECESRAMATVSFRQYKTEKPVMGLQHSQPSAAPFHAILVAGHRYPLLLRRLISLHQRADGSWGGPEGHYSLWVAV